MHDAHDTRDARHGRRARHPQSSEIPSADTTAGGWGLKRSEKSKGEMANKTKMKHRKTIKREQDALKSLKFEYASG